MRTWLIFLTLFFLTLVPAFAQDSISLAWDLSTSEPLEGGGYKIYASKQSGSYTEAPVAVVPAGTTEVTIDTSTWRGRYYLVATAFVVESDGAITEEYESGYSNEVTEVFTPNPPTNFRKQN